MDSFLLGNETGEFSINGTECENELNLYTESVMANQNSEIIVENIKKYYKEFLTCTYNVFLSITKLGDSFTPSIRGTTKIKSKI